MQDFALIKDGAVVGVARYPADASTFGPEPDGDVLGFDCGEVVNGMLWDGESLTTPPAPPEPEPPPPIDRHAELVAAGFTSAQADAILAVLT